MSKQNQKTLEVYENYADVYLEGGLKKCAEDPEKVAEKQKTLEKFLLEKFGVLPVRSKILEIGSADGKNARFLHENNFNITASDVATGFLREIEKQGLTPLRFNVLTDPLDHHFNGVLAWRVFVHFTKKDATLALNKIYELLTPGGILIFNVLNKADKNGLDSAWVDYPGAYHMGVERFFQHYSKQSILRILKNAGFELISCEADGGDNGRRWFNIVAKKPLGVNLALVEYVETKIFPRYAALAGHSIDHILQVITRSLYFANQVNQKTPAAVDLDMVYAIAAYHDLGREIDNETHEKISAKLLLKDETIASFFIPDQLKIMAEAVADHRASLDREPRSIYGRIVSTADRNTDPLTMLKRCFEYRRELSPDAPYNDIVEEARKVLRKKYGGTSGYAAKKVYFPDPDFETCLLEIERLTADPVLFRATLETIISRK